MFKRQQQDVFEIIKSKLPSRLKLADAIMDVLGVSSDSSYRRIRGEKELTFSELMTLCSYFDISVDALLGKQDDHVLFRYNSLDLKDLNNYRTYIKQFDASVQALSGAKEKEIYYTAEDIPIFHFLPFRELTFFKVYVWHNAVAESNLSYEQFVDQIENKDELFACYDNLYKNYTRIPSTEIWTTSSLSPILQLFDYYKDIGAFEEKKNPGLLCFQLLQMTERLMQWAEVGKKDGGGDFKLYHSATHPENSFMLLKKDTHLSATIKLFTINSIITHDPSFCEETERWINNLMTKSVLLSGASARERFKFFQNMKNRINNLMELCER